MSILLLLYAGDASGLGDAKVKDMNIWERVAMNIQKGLERVSAFAALFSERVKVELKIVRLRMRIDAVQKRIDVLHRTIGRRVLELRSSAAPPRSTEQLLKDEAISAAITEIAEREKEMEDLNLELSREAASGVSAHKKSEDTIA